MTFFHQRNRAARRMWAWGGLVLSLCIGPRQSPISVGFLPASIDSAGVWFDPPVPLDWDAIARQALPGLDLQRPDTALLSRYWNEPSGQSAIPFRAPLPPALSRPQFVGLAIGGSVVLVPFGLGGFVDYDTGPPTWTLSGYRTYGRILSKPRPTPRGSAAPPVVFVAWSEAPITFEPGTASVSATGLQLRVTASTSGGRRSWTLQPDSTWLDVRRLRKTASTMFTDSRNRKLYILVGGDTDLCEGIFLLYDVTVMPRLLAQRAGACDA